MTKGPKKPIALKELAALLELSPATVSRIINGQGAAFRIAEKTQQRVLKAAAQHGYTANAVARSLRQQRTHTVGVIVPEISEGYSTAVLSGIEDELLKDGYFYLVVSHRHRRELLEAYPRMLLARSVEGIIAIDTPIDQELHVPVVAVSGHKDLPHSMRIELDHDEAASQALSHLKAQGHQKIAFIKGQVFSSDTAQRWDAIVRSAKNLGLSIDPKLVVQLKSPEPGPEPGVAATHELLRSGRPFSAVFAFNDVTAIGAIRALREEGLRVPQEISVLGFDDILAASTHNPPLTTVRQPLRDMGKLAAVTLLQIIRGELPQMRSPVITVHPQLIVRDSTGPASGMGLSSLDLREQKLKV